MVRLNIIQYISYAIALIISLTLCAAQAYAATAFDATMCNIDSIVTGPAGKTLAAVAIVATGVGFFTGKISWTLMIAMTMGIASIYGAPTVVSALTGQEVFECEEGKTYLVTTTDGINFYSCPRGFTGRNCDVCATGYTGASCSGCDIGYIGSDCSQCDTSLGYSSYNGACYQNCTVSGILGTTISTVSPGVGYVPCNANPNFTGSVSYRCDRSFNATGSCSCIGNYDIATSCSSCKAGYTGADCNSCQLNYTDIGGVCHQNCSVMSVPGITPGTTALPPYGTLTCENSLGYIGSIDYTCNDGSFNTNDSCSTYNVSSCYQGSRHNTLTLSAPAGKVWKGVIYARYGAVLNCAEDPDPTCPGNYRSISLKQVVENRCLNQNSCALYINDYLVTDQLLNPEAPSDLVDGNTCTNNTDGVSQDGIFKVNVIMWYSDP